MTEKLGRYYVMEHWGHIFSEGIERDVRFVIDTSKLSEGGEKFLVTMQYMVNHRWQNLTWTGCEDVLQSLNDNELIGEIDEVMNGLPEGDFVGDGTFTDTLPDWAKSN